MNILHLFSHNEARPHDRERSSPVQFSNVFAGLPVMKGEMQFGFEEAGLQP